MVSQLNKRVAITGGRGRMAGSIARRLNALGAETVCFSRQEGEGLRPLSDLCDSRKLATFDAVLHLAWSSVPLTSEQDPGCELRSDIPLLRGMLDAMGQCPVSPQIVFFSSASVYGNCVSPAAEDSPLCPLGNYARAKLLAEEVIWEAAQTHPALRFAVLRVSNVFGLPDHSSRPQGVVARLCGAVRDGTALTVWGDGHATKDYLFFDDLLSALALAFKHRLHGTFNVASERSVSLREIIALAGNEAGRDLEVRETPHFPWDVERTAISAGKFRLATGWCARTDALEAIRELIKTELAQCR